MKLTYLKNAENAYNAQLQQMKQIPSASKQFKLWRSALEEGNETQKRFNACINAAGDLVRVANIINEATNRYANGYNGKKFISYVYLFQAAQKELKRIMWNNGTIDAQDNCKELRKAYARYMRAELTFKHGGQLATYTPEDNTTEEQPTEE